MTGFRVRRTYVFIVRYEGTVRVLEARSRSRRLFLPARFDITPAFFAQRLPIPRPRRGSTCSPQNFSIEIFDDLPEGHSLSRRKRELRLGAVYGRGFAATRLRARELIPSPSAAERRDV
jgi:hypothetical protein